MLACRNFVIDHWCAMQLGSTPGRGFGKGILIKKSIEKCIWKGVLDQQAVPEMGFSAGFLIRTGF